MRWVFVSMGADSKIVRSYVGGARDGANARLLMSEPASRITARPADHNGRLPLQALRRRHDRRLQDRDRLPHRLAKALRLGVPVPLQLRDEPANQRLGVDLLFERA